LNDSSDPRAAGLPLAVAAVVILLVVVVLVIRARRARRDRLDPGQLDDGSGGQ
jgi:hypothetical protein